MSQGPALTRRQWLIGSSLVAGSWTLGVRAAAPGAALNPWLRLNPDGGIVVLTPVAEMGQGTHSCIRQIVAEELAQPLARIRMEPAPVTPAFNNPLIQGYATFGSIGFRSALQLLGPICAELRERLLGAAALAWQCPQADCQIGEGLVLHTPTGRRLMWAALFEAAAALPAPAAPPVRRANRDWRVLGQAVPRDDLWEKVEGRACFGIDVQRPGAAVATSAHAPQFGGRLLRVDPAPAMAVPGVRRVVSLPQAVAVVADGYWAALQGLRALKPVWGPGARVSSTDVSRRLRHAAMAGRGLDYGRDEDARQDPAATRRGLAGAARVLDQAFELPFVPHAAMEPLNATAEVGPQGATLWLSTQNPGDTQRVVAQTLGLQRTQVTVVPQLIGGGFGRRLEVDVAIEAALIARAHGGPVHLIWSRETDLASGYYRNAAAARVRLGLGADGLPVALRADLAGPSLLEHTQLTNGPASPIDWTAAMGWSNHAYDIVHLHLNWTRVELGVPCGYWRSVGASQSVFCFEHMLDLAARAAGVDPLHYRLRLLAGKPQRRAFVEALAQRAGWGQALPPGHVRGVAINQGNDAVSGHVVELSVPSPGRFRLHRITAALDADVIVNPDTARAQLMGGTVFGLSAALFTEVRLKDGRVEQQNFDTLRLARMADVPDIDCLVLGLKPDGDPRGIGEEGVASIAPAIANALLAATGKPVTQLPLSRAGWQLRGA